MNRIVRSRMIGNLALCLSLAGCGAFSPRPDPSRFFTLTAFSQAEAVVAKDERNPGGVSLGIGPIKLPGYLDRQEIVTRTGQNRFDVSEYDRWAEPLDENFTRVLTQNLSALLRPERISSYPWPVDKKPNYQVEIEVLRFEANAKQEIQLSARWAVIDDICKEASNLNKSHLSRPAKEKSTDASVSALSETVADLSREIAKTVIAIDRQRKA